jgi:hypothetical protein
MISSSLCLIGLTLTIIELSQVISFTIFTRTNRHRPLLEAKPKDELDRPNSFIDDKNIEQSLFNPPPRAKKMMNQRGVITDVEDVVTNLPLGCDFIY